MNNIEEIYQKWLRHAKDDKDLILELEQIKNNENKKEDNLPSGFWYGRTNGV